jgi:hypothetical protein
MAGFVAALFGFDTKASYTPYSLTDCNGQSERWLPVSAIATGRA